RRGGGRSGSGGSVGCSGGSSGDGDPRGCRIGRRWPCGRYRHREPSGGCRALGGGVALQRETRRTCGRGNGCSGGRARGRPGRRCPGRWGRRCGGSYDRNGSGKTRTTSRW
ncbi:unnamed protein product, partial [Laminaria digitata]